MFLETNPTPPLPQKKDMDFFPLSLLKTASCTLWIVAGFGLVSTIQLVISHRSNLKLLDRPSHLQTNRDVSIHLALHFTFGYPSMPYSALSSPFYQPNLGSFKRVWYFLVNPYHLHPCIPCFSLASLS